MRTMILALAVVLLAAPAWAVVFITATDEGGGVVRIDYNSVGEANLPRAFALDITVSEGNIVDCCDYAVGDDNNGFGIFPGSFGVLYVDPESGLVESWNVGGYTPVANPATHPTALGLDPNGMTVEMGSLYDTNAPLNFGTLCRVTVDTLPCTLSVTLNGLSGNIVMEDANEPDVVDLTGATDVPIGDECIASGDPRYEMWVQKGKPDCWCYECFNDGDSNGDCFVAAADVKAVIDAWTPKPYGPCADFNNDGFVAAADVKVLIDHWPPKPGCDPGCTSGLP